MKTFLLLLISISAKAQFYAGFNLGTYKDKPQGGIVAGFKENNVRLQLTQIVPITANNNYPVLHDFTFSCGNNIIAYAGATLCIDGANANTYWKPSIGVGFYKNTWFFSTGLINNKFKISLACIKLFE